MDASSAPVKVIFSIIPLIKTSTFNLQTLSIIIKKTLIPQNLNTLEKTKIFPLNPISIYSEDIHLPSVSNIAKSHIHKSITANIFAPIYLNK